jgi:hypothetical protein
MHAAARTCEMGLEAVTSIQRTRVAQQTSLARITRGMRHANERVLVGKVKTYTPTRSAVTVRRTPPRGMGRPGRPITRFFFCFLVSDFFFLS